MMHGPINKEMPLVLIAAKIEVLKLDRYEVFHHSDFPVPNNKITSGIMHTLYIGIDMYSVLSRIEQYFPPHVCLFYRNPSHSVGEFRYHTQRQTQQYGLIKKNIFSPVFSDTTIFPGTYGNS